jgi:GH15 family glucan-1,4-alpha-glucosidase
VRIEEYGFIGDTHSGGLVGTNGSLDWLCLPRFDAPSCFAALLDPRRGGHWRIAPAEPVRATSRTYRGHTMVLETRFETASGRVCLVDCLPIEPGSDPRDPRSIHPEAVIARQVRGEGGTVPMRMEYRPRFDYGSIRPWFRPRHGVLEAVGGPDALDLITTVPLEVDRLGARAAFVLRAGQEESFVAAYHRSHLEPRRRSGWDCGELIAPTERFWKDWADRCDHDGPWRDAVLRSLLVLKALTFSPSGGVVAAPTTSLPEQLGGPRNWDYRYCWLRDATFTLDILVDHGYLDEAREWRDWLLRAVAGDPEDLQIMYGPFGERRLHEVELPGLAGYEGSRPVRIGNAAFSQFQLDVYGEVLDSMYSGRRAGIPTSDDAWRLQTALVDFVCERWTDPDRGIREVRSRPRHFVHSKVMAWVALDRAIKQVERAGHSGDVARWREVRDRIRHQVLRHGVTEGRLRRAYDDDEVDASLLTLPLLGFLDAQHPLMRATIEAVERDLLDDGFVLRYRTDRTTDGLPPGEGAFIMCTFWLVDCLVLLGRIDEAGEMFERLLGIRNDLGLLSEQYDPHGRRLLGNHPQAFSHVALVAAADSLRTAGRARSVQRGRPAGRREAGGV